MCVCGDFNLRTKYHYSISKKFSFVTIIGECNMVGQNLNKYHGDEICYIVIYSGVFGNISILC